MNLLKLEFLLLRYVPSALADEAMNIGLLVWNENFAEVRFTTNWDRLLRFDPNADLEMLEAICRDIGPKMHSADWRQMVQKIEDSFSNIIQCSKRGHCLCADPVREVENLASIYFQDHPLDTSQRLGF